jgi:hypothetical protein
MTVRNGMAGPTGSCLILLWTSIGCFWSLVCSISCVTLSLGSLQVEQSPLQAASMYDSVGSHIPQKNKEKIWASDYIELSLLLRSVKELVSDPQ